jgi:DNA adenine methylase
MRYLGGKSRLSGRIVEQLEKLRHPNQIYFEPFVGSAAVVSKMGGIRIASDINSDLISLWRANQTGYEFPECVTKDEYDKVRSNPSVLDDTPHLRAFYGICCSFGGKWFGGYAQGGGRNFADEAKRGLQRIKTEIQDVAFLSKAYDAFAPKGMLIYCDPPYANTTKYDFAKDFDTCKFWKTMLEWSKDNVVVVSEYTCPLPDTEVLAEWETKTTVSKSLNLNSHRIDKLFLIRYIND